MRFKLARQAVEVLDDAGIAHAVIGAAAMPAHGYVRATMDFDLVVFDGRAFHPETWLSLEGVPKVIRVADDPIGRPGRRQCDVIMPRGRWHQEIIARAQAEGPVLRVDGRDVPVVTLPDLIVLKLNAGGPLDLRDIEELLNANPDVEAAIVGAVDGLVRGLPGISRRRGRKFVPPVPSSRPQGF